jgi:hypothetical protein
MIDRHPENGLERREMASVSGSQVIHSITYHDIDLLTLG